MFDRSSNRAKLSVVSIAGLVLDEEFELGVGQKLRLHLFELRWIDHFCLLQSAHLVFHGWEHQRNQG